MKPEVSQWSVRSLEIISRCTSLLFRLQPTPRRSQPRPRLASAAAQFETSWTSPSARLQPITSQPIVERSMAIAASAAWNTPAASSQPIIEQSRRLRLISRRRSSSSRAGQLGFPRRGSPRAGQLECLVLVTRPLPLIIVASLRIRCSYRSNRKYSAQRELFFFMPMANLCSTM